MRVHEAVGEIIVAEGVRHIFGLMGHGNIKVIPNLVGNLGVDFYATRHEGNAVLMADGYARTSGRVGVCTVTQGPGLTNTLTGLVTARKARTPLIVLAGDGPNVAGNVQWIDQDAVFAAAGIPVQRIRSAETLGDDLVSAFHRARTDRTPVGVNMLPLAMQDRECSLRLPPVAPDGAVLSPARPDSGAIDRAADILEQSRRPVILAGRGAAWSDARAEIETLAESIGALLATSLLGKSLFDRDPYSLGIVGGFGSKLSSRLVAAADCVLVFGASLNPFTTDGGELFGPETELIQCDLDEAAIGAMIPVTHGLHGDAAATARSLRKELDRRAFRQDGYRTPPVRAELDRWRPEAEFEDVSEKGALDPRALMLALEPVLPRQRVLVAAGGHCQGWPAMYLSVPDPFHFVHPLNFGAVGCGLGAALGAAVARPDVPTVLVLGDGDLMMALADLDTAVRYDLPLIVVVLDDGGFGSEVHSLREWGLRETEAFYENPDFAELGRAVGGNGITVRTLDDLEEVGGRAAALDRMLVVDCKVTRDVRADWDVKLQARTGAKDD